MTRVSLKEAYDNKDVVAQIYAIRDTAESAVDTSEQAVTTANTASDHVDALVPQVEGAVQNANSASASAQASAQTVAGYDERLTEVEGDLNAVTLRVTTAEGDIVTIQGRVTALETADGQNVKLTGEHAIGNYAVLLTGTQTKTGELTLINPVPMVGKWFTVGTNGANPTYWAKICTINIPNRTGVGAGRCIMLEVQVGRDHNRGMHAFLYVMGNGFHVSGFYIGTAPEFKMTVDNNDDSLVTLWVRYNAGYCTFIAREINDRSYSDQLNYGEKVTMNTDPTVVADISGYNISYDPDKMSVIQ